MTLRINRLQSNLFEGTGKKPPFLKLSFLFWRKFKETQMLSEAIWFKLRVDL